MSSKLDKAVKIRKGQSLKTDSLEIYVRNAMELPEDRMEVLQFP